MMPLASDLTGWRLLAAVLITVNGATTFYGLRKASGSQQRAIEYTGFSCTIMVILMTPYLVPYLFGPQRVVAVARVYVPIAYAVAFVLIGVYVGRVLLHRERRNVKGTKY
jgi:hypothetical protein